MPFDSPSLFFRCVPNKKLDVTEEAECIEGVEIDGQTRTDVDGGCLKQLVTKTVKSEEATQENVLLALEKSLKKMKPAVARYVKPPRREPGRAHSMR